MLVQQFPNGHRESGYFDGGCIEYAPVIQGGVAMRQHVAEGNDQRAFGNAGEKVRIQLAEPT
jgi:hypothetical protein